MGSFRAPRLGRPFFHLAAAAALVALAAHVVVAAAAEQQDQDDDPPAVTTTEAVIVAHNIYLQRRFFTAIRRSFHVIPSLKKCAAENIPAPHRLTLRSYAQNLNIFVKNGLTFGDEANIID